MAMPRMGADKLTGQSDVTTISQPSVVILLICNGSTLASEEAVDRIAQTIAVAIDVCERVVTRGRNRVQSIRDNRMHVTPEREVSDPVAQQTRIHLDGTRSGRRLQIVLDDRVLGITERSFELLLRLVVALHQSPPGWVHRSDLGEVGDQSQAVSRLRSELRPGLIDPTRPIIENNGAGAYRLSLPPTCATADLEKLFQDSNRVIRELALKLQSAAVGQVSGAFSHQGASHGE